MGLQLLISALNKNPAELTGQMNMECPAVLVNQCDEEKTEEIIVLGQSVKVISMKERGVGLSRNTCIENATEETVLFSDDDIVYDSGYVSKVEEAFARHPDADVLLFNVRVSENRRTYWNTEDKKLGKTGVGRYPAYSIAAKRESLIKSGVRFSLLFGGGAKYSNGEDSLFLTDCLRNGLILYSVTDVIGEEKENESTWFKGFTEKFFFDRGVLFAFLYTNTALIWAFRFVFLKKNIDTSGVGKKTAWKKIREGIKEGKKLRKCSST